MGATSCSPSRPSQRSDEHQEDAAGARDIPVARPLAEPDQWGLGSAHRPIGLDREIVKLVRAEAGFIAREPTLVEAIVFVVAIDDERWRIDELGIADPAI